MNPRLTTELGILLLLMTAGCRDGRPAPFTAGDEAAIRAISESHARDFTSGQLERVVGTFTEDAIYMLANEPLVQGRAAIRDKLAELPRVTGYTAPVVAIEGGGNMAVARGTYSVAYQSSSGATDTGKYIYVLHRQTDDTWRIAWAIWNSDLPPQRLDLAPVTVEAER